MTLLESPRASLGLDLSPHAILLVELLSRDRGVELATYAQVSYTNPLLTAASDSAGDTAVKQTAAIIKRMFDQAEVATDRAVLGLPSSVVFGTILTVPKASQANLSEVIRFNAREVVPVPLDEVTLGWSSDATSPDLRPNKTSAKGKVGVRLATKQRQPLTAEQGNTMDVYVAAIPRYLISRYQHVAQLLDLELLTLEIDTFALVRALVSPTDTMCLVNIQEQNATISLIDQGTPQIQVNISRSNNSDQAFTKAVAEATTDLLANAAKYTSSSIAKIVLTGSGALALHSSPVWVKPLKRRTSLGNSLAGLRYPNQLEAKTAQLNTTYATAIGLARRGLPAIY
ncbi:pilus assembly protein PilM [Patescibacteria group bacterium]|nr:pilus assembly protein PilM [Patescibacteria group bacterium]